MLIAELILWTCAAYLAVGLLLGVPFALWGVNRVDPAAQGASLMFRLLILPGCIALWPWVTRRWLSVKERVNHS